MSKINPVKLAECRTEIEEYLKKFYPLTKFIVNANYQSKIIHVHYTNGPKWELVNQACKGLINQAFQVNVYRDTDFGRLLADAQK